MVLAPNYSRMITPAPPELELKSHPLPATPPSPLPGARLEQILSACCVALGSSYTLSGCLASLAVLRVPANPQTSDALGLPLPPTWCSLPPHPALHQGHVTHTRVSTEDGSWKLVRSPSSFPNPRLRHRRRPWTCGGQMAISICDNSCHLINALQLSTFHSKAFTPQPCNLLTNIIPRLWTRKLRPEAMCWPKVPQLGRR